MFRAKIISSVCRTQFPSFGRRGFHAGDYTVRPSRNWEFGIGGGLLVGATGTYLALQGLDQANAAPAPNQKPKNEWGVEEEVKTKPKNLGKGFDATTFFTISVLASAATVAFLLSRYKRCPSNQILVIQGALTGGKGARVLHGGGAYVFPLIQEHAFLSLEPIQIEAPLRGALSLENIRINVPSVFTVGISTNPEICLNAAQRLLGLGRDEVAHQAKDIIFGQLRQVVAGMRIEDINRSREQFVNNVKTNIEHELEKIGLELINVNITDLTDDAGYLSAMGRKAAQEAIQKAEVDVAEQEKFGQIGVTEFRKDTALRKAILLRDQSIGEATAKFAQETEVKAQERDMRVKVAALNADTIKGENEAKEQIATSNAKLAIKQAEAFRESETRKKEAEAAVKEAQAKAEARAAIEVGNKIEADKRAEFEAPAKALRAKVIVDAEAKAEEARIISRGQAEALYAKLEAEARGQLEILKSKADGMKLMVESCGGSQEAFQLLMLEHVDKLAETASKAISNIKFDKIVVWDGGKGGNGSDNGNAAATFLRGLAGSLPPTMHLMKDIAGVEMPTYFGKILDEKVETQQKILALIEEAQIAVRNGNYERADELNKERERLEVIMRKPA